MATQVTCPHCKRKNPKQHQRFCNKNPNRIKGPGRPPAAQEKAPPAPPQETGASPVTETPAAPEPSPAGNDGTVPAPIQPEFKVEDTARAPSAMPNLEPTTAPVQPAPPVVPQIGAGPFVDVLAGLFDQSLVQADGAASGGPPQPPPPISADERKMLTAALDPLLAKYLPMMGPYAIELTALLVVAGVVVPRLIQAKARNMWIEEHKRPPPQVPANTPRPTEDDLLRIGDKWVGRVSTP